MFCNVLVLSNMARGDPGVIRVQDHGTVYRLTPLCSVDIGCSPAYIRYRYHYGFISSLLLQETPSSINGERLDTGPQVIRLPEASTTCRPNY